MAILGLRDTTNFVANQRPENWREALMLLYPNSAEAAKAPLTALTSLMKSEDTNDPVFHWWEKSLDDRRVELNESLDTTETVITIVADARTLKAGDMLLVEQSGEVLRVAQDPVIDTEITVTRGMSGTTPTAVTHDGAAVNPNLVVIGSAYEEGSHAPTGVNYDPAEKSNYTQIFRSTMEVTRTAQKTRLRTGDAVKEARRECLEYIGIDMERAFWFGKRGSTTYNQKPLRTTGGFVWFISTYAPSNIIASGGTIDMNDLEAFMEQVFRVGSSEKMAFGSNVALLALQQAIRKNTTWNFTNTKEFGMAVTRFTSPFGELVFKVHPLFNQMRGGTNQGASAYLAAANNLYILDTSELVYRYIDDLKYEGDLTAIGQDAKKAGYLAECGIELHHPTSHFIWTGLTSGVADS